MLRVFSRVSKPLFSLEWDSPIIETNSRQRKSKWSQWISNFVYEMSKVEEAVKTRIEYYVFMNKISTTPMTNDACLINTYLKWSEFKR